MLEEIYLLTLTVTSVGYGDGISMPEEGFMPFNDNIMDFHSILVGMLFGSMIFNLP
jgi:hypothetical protein